MANITGTPGPDLDTIDGGAGNDTLDFTGTTFSSVTTPVNFRPLGPVFLSINGDLVTNSEFLIFRVT